jgi:hypothetical protein
MSRQGRRYPAGYEFERDVEQTFNMNKAKLTFKETLYVSDVDPPEGQHQHESHYRWNHEKNRRE